MRIAIGVEYAGDAFEGWQSQGHGRTVQDALEQAIGRIASHPVRLHCAGRTDAGVHATPQVPHFDTFSERPLSSWIRGVNSQLRGPVVVRWAVVVDDGFHARFLACGRRYRYIVHNHPVRPALLAGRVGWFHVPLHADPVFAEFLQTYGKAALMGDDEYHVKRLGRLFWFTVEFGLIREDGRLKIYGSGLPPNNEIFSSSLSPWHRCSAWPAVAGVHLRFRS